MSEKNEQSLRRESDQLGERELPADALYGVHTLRAMENFPLSGRPVRPAMIAAYGQVKLACAMTNHALGDLDDDVFAPLESACREMVNGLLNAHIRVDALQGGAGTSLNMNVNEVLANRALQIAGRRPGDYYFIHPIEHVNLHQSTNDTFPTALRVAAITLGRVLERELVALQEALQEKEKAFADIVKIGRTQLQDAVLVTLGREMGAYAEAFGRDRWRVHKCEERLRTVNLGGTAVGTGLGAPREFIFRATETLRNLTGLGIGRAENLMEATQNADAFVEVSGILKACATNLLKISTDLRLMSSGPSAGLGEIKLPALQAGSSIMPGKVNPVVPEAVSQAAMRVMANDAAVAQAVSMGNLELNPFLPLVAEALLESIELLSRACGILRERCVEGIEADAERCRLHVENSTAVTTALVEQIGYEAAGELAKMAAEKKCSIREAAIQSGRMSAEAFDACVQPEAVNRLGSPRREKKD